MSAKGKTPASGRKRPGRRAAREAALTILYQCEARGKKEVLAEIDRWTRKIVESDYAESLVRDVLSRRLEIDRKIRRASANWKVSRIAAVERNILRIGACEILARPEVPRAVAVNEAVRLAKRFGGAKSHAFVNGVLDAIARAPVSDEEE